MRRWLACLLVSFALARPARATVVLDLPLTELTRRSSLVIRGVVEVQSAGWDDSHRQIRTKTTIRVDEILRGARPPGSVVVDQPGGEIGSIGQHVEGVAHFRVGEEVVVFLEPHRAHAGWFTLVSLAAAKFAVTKEGTTVVAVRDLTGLSFARRGVDGVARIDANVPQARIGLDELRAIVGAHP